ncbi:MAG: hypothetical protein V5A31_13745 [Haloferacaceae archaeon]
MPPSAATVARRLRRLDHDARVAFVAALYAAGGDAVTVAREGPVLVVDGPAGLRRVVVGPPADNVDADAVVVVTDRDRARAEGIDARLLGPAALHDRLCYGVDRETAARLCRAHLGVPFDASDGGHTRRRRVAATLVLLAAAGLVAALALSVPVGPGGEASDAGSARAGDATPAPVTAADLRDSETVARGHLAALRARPSVRLNATFAGPRHLTGFDTLRSGYDRDDVVSVSMRVGADGRYRSVRRTSFAGGPLIRDRVAVARYADGGTEYVRIDGEPSLRYERRAVTRSGRAFAADWSRRLLPRYLTTNRTRVERLSADADARYRVVATGSPRGLDHEVRGYRAAARVAADGLVTRLSVGYDHPTTGARVSVTARFGSPAAVPAPPWYETARERTGENA